MNQIITGDCRHILKKFKDGYFDMVMCSPPYWGIRDYGLAPQVWIPKDLSKIRWSPGIHENIIANCEKKGHQWGKEIGKFGKPGHGKHKNALTDKTGHDAESKDYASGQFCTRCGAWLGSLGLEPTTELFIDHLIEVFTEVARVTKDTGSIWVNLNDTYGKSGCGKGTKADNPNKYNAQGLYEKPNPQSKAKHGMQLLPERFALHMCDQLGLILVNKIVWYKPDVKPESVKRRFTRDWEPIYVFVKDWKKYYFKQQFEGYSEKTVPREKYGHGDLTAKYSDDHPYKYMQTGKFKLNDQGRNMRTVWSIPQATPTRQDVYKHVNVENTGHYATYPRELVARCIKAGCPKNGVVLDHFCGIGTTCITAHELGRKYVGIELNPDYAQIARDWLGSYLI